MAYAQVNDTIYVNDPGSGNTPYYPISQVVDGQTGLYAPHSSTYHNLIGKIQKILRAEDDAISTMADRPRISVAQPQMWKIKQMISIFFIKICFC